MQNKFKNFRNFLKGKGYYIVLLLCTAAVGVTGYFLLTDKEGTLPVETTLNTNSSESTIHSASPSVGKDPATDVAATQDPSESTATPEKRRLQLQKPVGGDTLAAYSMDHLAYNATTRDWRTHEGIDLSATLGEEVCAAADGTVYSIYEDEQFGMTVVLHHEGGYSTHYANLSEDVPVSVGQALKSGEILGTVGNTAGVEQATDSHIHFALYLDNTPIDPNDHW